MKSFFHALIATTLILQGCSAQKEVRARHAYAKDLFNQVETAPSTYIDEPSILPPVPIVSEPNWLKLPANFAFEDTAFSVVAGSLARIGTPMPIPLI